MISVSNNEGEGMKKIVLYTTGVLIAWMIFVEVNALAIMPFIVAGFLMYQVVFQGKNRSIAIGVIAGLMALGNMLLGEISLVDSLVWVVILIAYGRESK